MIGRLVVQRFSAEDVTGVLGANPYGLNTAVFDWERLAAICATRRLAVNEKSRLLWHLHANSISMKRTE
jgi:hypothetical protein